MTANRNAQLSQPVYDRHSARDWQCARLELLRPQRRQRQAKRRREALLYGMLAVLLFCSALAYMYFEARINVAGREVNVLQEQIAETHKAALITELEIGNLSSLARVESYAKIRLGMVYPDVNSVQYLNQQVSAQLATDLQLLAEEPLTEEAVTEERLPLFVAWAELIGQYFNGTALAAEN